MERRISMKKILLSLLLVLALCFASVAVLPVYANAETAVSVTDLKFRSASLALHSDLTIIFLIDRTVIENGGYENPYVVFTLNGTETIVKDYTVNSMTYAFRFSHIAPDRMNDSVTAVPYATKNGKLCQGIPQPYSIATYCKNMLNKATTTDVEKTMLVDLLNYGAATQIFTNHRTDALANEALTTEQKQFGTAETPTLKSVRDKNYATIENPLATWESAALRLNQSVSIQLTFSTTENPANLSVRVTEKNGKLLHELDASLLTKKDDGTIQLKYQGLSACYFRKTVLFTVYKQETPISNTLAYSIESYASAKKDCGTASLENLVSSMMKYGNSCFRYAFGVYERRQDVRTEYQTLTEEEKQIYREIVAKIKENATSIHLDGVTHDVAEDVFTTVCRDYPEFFWIRGATLSYTSSYTNITPNRIVTSQETLTEMIADYQAAIDEIVREAKNQPTLYDTVLYVHDTLIDNTVYDEETAGYATDDKPETTGDPFSYTAYGCVILKKAVCQGYATAFQNIMQQLGIPCGMITGDANGSHAWNLIMLEDDYYYMDLTWDDPVSKTPIKRHTYFCVTSQDLCNRTVDETCFAPKTTATAYNYFVYNGLYFTNYDLAEIGPILEANKDLDKISLRFASKEALNLAINDLSSLRSAWGKSSVLYPDDDSSPLYILSLFAN